MIIIRIKSELELFNDPWFVSFAIVTLIAMNAGAFLLCFRRKKYICVFVLCELVSLVLFFSQVYLIVV